MSSLMGAEVLADGVAVVDEVLDADALDNLIEYAIGREADFVGAWVLRAALDALPEIDLRVRRNLHLKGTSNVPSVVMERIRDVVPPLASLAGASYPEIMRGVFEAEITATGDGGFFLPHRDNGNPRLRDRTISFVLFFGSSRFPFRGGELRVARVMPDDETFYIFDECADGRLGHPDVAVTIEPKCNRLATFRSDLLHEVRPVYTNPNDFRSWRFAVTGFIRLRDRAK
jgi:hypothetical protein